MVKSKKGSKKKSSNKPKKSRAKTEIEKNIDKAIINNFIALQKVMVNLSGKFDNLSAQISKLLDLFEISAKSLASKDFESEKETKIILDKLENISQQAGLIGKGLSLIHQINVEKNFEESQQQRNYPPFQEQMPNAPTRQIAPMPIGYQKMSFNPQSESTTPRHIESNEKSAFSKQNR